MKGRLGPSFIDKEDASSILHGNQRAGSFSVPCLPTLSEESRAQFIHCCTSTVIITSGYLHRGARARTQQLEVSGGRGAASRALREARVWGRGRGSGGHTWRARCRLARAAKSAGCPADCISRKSLEAVFPLHCPQRVAFLPTRKFLPCTQLRPLSTSQLTRGVGGRC